ARTNPLPSPLASPKQENRLGGLSRPCPAPPRGYAGAMGQFSYKNEAVDPHRKILSEQFVMDLEHVAEGPLLALAKQIPGGYIHRRPFLRDAKWLFKKRLSNLAQDAAVIAEHLPWYAEALKCEKAKLLEHLDELAGAIGGPRAALLCVLWNNQAEQKEAALAADLLPRLLANAKAQSAKPDAKAWKAALAKLGGAAEKEPLDSVDALDSAGKTVRRLLQELSQGKAARENEGRQIRRQHANELEAKDAEIRKAREDAARQAQEAAKQVAALDANLAALQAKLTAEETEVARLRGELDRAREHVAKKAREIAEELLSEEIRPWLADARTLKSASEEVAKLRQLTTETVEKVRKAQRDADPFLAKEHELRQAIPQMEEMLKLLRRYLRTAGQALPEVVALEKRLTEHIEKVRYELEKRDQPSDPFLERISAKINGADARELKSIESALLLAEQSGLVDSRHADLYRRDLHRRRSYMADRAFHEQKQSGPLALLERAVATGEKARLALDANNFACLRQDYLGLRLPTKKNAQGESRFQLDAAARQKVVQLAEKLADDAPGLHVWVSFDGQQTALKTTNSRVRVTFSRAGAKADHDIMDLVAKDKTVEAPWFVVSDDIEVRDATAREGAYIIYNDALIQLLVNRGIRA
ncbi:MAG: YacP-like domain, partial [Verrucomicrobiota bacterium]